MSDRLRYRVDPGDVPASKAARRLHLTEAEFTELLPDLIERGFPRPDQTTGMFDLDAIDAWRQGRYPHLFLTNPAQAKDARAVVASRLAGESSG